MLAVVALLAGAALRQYGLAGGTAAPAGPASDPAAGAALGGVAPALPGGAAPAPRDALERARGLEGAVRQQAADLDQRIDAQGR